MNHHYDISWKDRLLFSRRQSYLPRTITAFVAGVILTTIYFIFRG